MGVERGLLARRHAGRHRLARQHGAGVDDLHARPVGRACPRRGCAAECPQPGRGVQILSPERWVLTWTPCALAHSSPQRIAMSTDADVRLELYTLFLATAEKVSDRRLQANTWMLSVNSAVVGLYGYLGEGKAS